MTANKRLRRAIAALTPVQPRLVQVGVRKLGWYNPNPDLAAQYRAAANSPVPGYLLLHRRESETQAYYRRLADKWETGHWGSPDCEYNLVGKNCPEVWPDWRAEFAMLAVADKPLPAVRAFRTSFSGCMTGNGSDGCAVDGSNDLGQTWTCVSGGTFTHHQNNAPTGWEQRGTTRDQSEWAPNWRRYQHYRVRSWCQSADRPWSGSSVYLRPTKRSWPD